MKVYLANDIIRLYVAEVVKKRPEIMGVYISGSFLEMNTNDELPETSDVDLVIIIDQAQHNAKIGKISYHDLLLEISFLDPVDFMNRERLLLTHYIGNALIHDSILFDPRNLLLKSQKMIRQDFFKLHWINRRIDEMMDRIKDNLKYFQADMHNPTCINSYFFTLGTSVFPFLLADCRNLTVRKRYAAARAVLFTYGYEAMYQKLINLIAGSMNVNQLSIHLKALESVFDRAAFSEGKSAEYAYRHDIRPHSRQIAIDGCYELLKSPCPMESVFWIGATFSRSYTILQLDHPDVHLDKLIDFLRDTGINSNTDIYSRLDMLHQMLPEIEEAAKHIASNSSNRFVLGARHPD